MNRFVRQFQKGIVGENPILRLMIGLCPVLAVSVRMETSLAMGGAVIFVMTCSSIVVSLIRRIVPPQVRIPIFIVIISTFVTIVDLVMKAYLPPLSRALGIFVPLIVVNCMIMGRAEAFASKQPVGMAIADALGMGVGFTFIITAIGFVRELFGHGELLSVQVFPENYQSMLFMILPPGAFLIIGVYIGIISLVMRRRRT